MKRLMDASIVCQKLRKSFGPLVAVEDLSINVQGGEIYGLVGPDGAGKTTAIRLLCGVLRPEAGWVQVCGLPMNKQPDQARAQIGYLSQQFTLYEELTVMENLRFFAEVRGLKASEWRQRAIETLDFVGLSPFARRQARHLSGGMKQKLGLATALVHQPKVLLLDEPTGGVDPVTRQDFWQLIIRILAEARTAVLVSTPYMDEASRCTRVGFLSEGRLVVEGTPRELRARLEDRILELRGAPLNVLRRAAEEQEGVEAVHSFGDRLHLRVRPGASRKVTAGLKRRIPAAGGSISHLHPISPQLEDVFIDLLEARP